MRFKRREFQNHSGKAAQAATLVGLLTASVLLTGCGIEKKSSADTGPSPRPVLVERVHFAPITSARTLVATIKPRSEADLSFRVAGKVLHRMVDVGAKVKSGETLAVLDETDLKLQLEQAEAEVSAATGSLATAAAEMQRRLSLTNQGFSTQASMEQQKSAVDEARSRLTKGERALTLARDALGYGHLLADADGIVTAVLVEPGQVVAAGQTVVRVGGTAEREALVAIPESMVELAHTGEASVTLWSGNGKVYRASLRELSPAADPATRTYAARFSLPDAGPEVAWGMTATVSLANTDTAAVARLPLAGLFNDSRGPALWVVDRASGALTLKPVEVVKYDGTSVYVSKGVIEGEDVVTLGVQKLDAGQKVRVVTAIGS